MIAWPLRERALESLNPVSVTVTVNSVKGPKEAETDHAIDDNTKRVATNPGHDASFAMISRDPVTC